MSPAGRPTGRQKRIVSGGGNANRRGSGLGGGGPVGGGYTRPSGGSVSGGGSDRGVSGGGGLLAILAAILIGKAAAGGGNNGNGNNRRGCLSRIIIFAVVAFAVYFLFKSCAGNVNLSGGNYTDNSLPVYTDSTTDTGLQEAEATPSPSTAIQQLLNDSNANSTYTSTGSEVAYKAHQPDYTVAPAARDRYTTLQGNGNDTATIMVYMCGADLESKSGMGTSDLQEMLNATISDSVNVIVETGGASYWQNQVVSNSTNQIYQVRSGGLKRLVKQVGKKPMVSPGTLSEFIQYCQKNFPADRYMLIMWDHGGGSITGYGYDELFTSKGSMALDAFNTALSDGDCKFDFIGFDACLMATLETALVTEQYSDYLIASEATEPGTGWYYTEWLTKLSANPSMSTVDLSKIIIDDFVRYSQQNAPSSSATLSLTDLAELSGTVPEAFSTFSEATSDLIENDGFTTVANARSAAKDFSASTRINQIDLIHFAENMNTNESLALAKALQGCVKYNRCGNSITHANGLTIYFPYQSLSKVSTAVNTYEKIGMDDGYTRCIQNFASVAAGSSLVGGGSSGGLGSLMGNSSGGSLLGSLLGSSDVSDMLSGSSADSGDMLGSLTSLLGDSGTSSASSGTDELGDLTSLLGGSGSGSSSIGSSLAGSLLSSLADTGSSSASSSSGGADTVSTLLNMFLRCGDGGRSIVTGDSDNSWLNTDLLTKASTASYLAANRSGFDGLMLTEKNGQNVLELTEDQWAQVKSLEMNVFLDDGEGYIDLGLDNVMEYYDEASGEMKSIYNDDGDLIMTFDGTWLSLDGQIVAYYFISQDNVGDDYTILGRIPAMLTHSRSDGDPALLNLENKEEDYPQAKKADTKKLTERVNLIVAFDNDHPYGYVLGAQANYQDTSDSVMKGLIALHKGDKLDFLCDYYGYDGAYSDSYYLGETMTLTDTDFEIGNAYINGQGGLDGVTYKMTYRLTDTSGAQYWTPTIGN